MAKYDWISAQEKWFSSKDLQNYYWWSDITQKLQTERRKVLLSYHYITKNTKTETAKWLSRTQKKKKNKTGVQGCSFTATQANLNPNYCSPSLPPDACFQPLPCTAPGTTECEAVGSASIVRQKWTAYSAQLVLSSPSSEVPRRSVQATVSFSQTLICGRFFCFVLFFAEVYYIETVENQAFKELHKTCK